MTYRGHRAESPPDRRTITLAYHDVAPREEPDSSGFPGPLAARYKLDPDQFEAHLDAISGTGVEVGLILEGTSPTLAMTFDDGGSSAVSTAEALERRGWRGHFFVTTSQLERPGFVGGEEVRELVRRGHVVGSHSHSHPTYMARLSFREIETEWQRSREALAEVLGEGPIHAAVPGGFSSPAVVQAAAVAGYRWLMTSKPVARVDMIDGVSVFGRYTVWARTQPQTAAAFVLGRRRLLAREALAWRLKQFAKTISPGVYETLRSIGARSPRG